jgi:hypothetical protein
MHSRYMRLAWVTSFCLLTFSGVGEGKFFFAKLISAEIVTYGSLVAVGVFF